MKKLTIYTALFAAAVVGLMACKKDASFLADYSTTEDMALLRVINAAPFFRQVTGLPDSFNLYVNGSKVNSPFLTYGSTFPGSATNNGYLAVPTGLQQIKLSVHGFSSTNYDSTLILNTTKVFTAGQQYTYFVTDSLKIYPDGGFVPDAYSKPLNGNVNIRFAHLIGNDTIGKVVDVFSYARNNTVFTNVKPFTFTGFQALGFNTGVADTFYVTRPAVAGTPITGRIVLAKLVLPVVNQRTYTLYYRGDANLTTGTKARTLSSYVHQ